MDKKEQARIDKILYPNRLMDVAYIRDGQMTHTDEAVILACLVRSKGTGRDSSDMKDLQVIMKDINLKEGD